jgi:hypothetical protein
VQNISSLIVEFRSIKRNKPDVIRASSPTKLPKIVHFEN